MSWGTRLSGKTSLEVVPRLSFLVREHPCTSSCFTSRISLPRMFFQLAPLAVSPFCVQLLLWLFSVVLDVPFLSSPHAHPHPCPSDLILASASALLPSPSLPCRWASPISCQAPPLGARGPPLNICKTSPGSSAPSAKLSSTTVPQRQNKTRQQPGLLLFPSR